MDLYNAGLTIGELSKRTGVGVTTLRAWERRHGFPVPQRLPSGHRRYAEGDAEAVRAVVRERANGATLESALARARDRSLAPRRSVFATLQAALPGTAPVVLSRTGMLAVSRAIEDEAAVRADDPVFFGMFQESKHWRQTKPVWRRIAARSSAVIALAAGLRGSAGPLLHEVAIPADHPVAQEWAVICDSPSFAACLVGVERPSRQGDRIFEALWTVDPMAVREAARTASAVAAAVATQLPQHVDQRLAQPASVTYDAIRAANALMNRSLVYLDRRASSGIHMDRSIAAS